MFNSCSLLLHILCHVIDSLLSLVFLFVCYVFLLFTFRFSLCFVCCCICVLFCNYLMLFDIFDQLSVSVFNFISLTVCLLFCFLTFFDMLFFFSCFPVLVYSRCVLSGCLFLRVRRSFGFVLGGLSGRVPSEVSCDVYSWWCILVSVRRFFGLLLGGNRFLQCNDAKVLFRVCCCYAS